MKRYLATAALACAFASLANAQQQVSVKFLGGNYGGNFTLSDGITTDNGAAGLLFNSWTPGYSTAGDPGGTKFTAYCLSPLVYIGQSGYNPWNADRSVDSGLGAIGGRIGWLAGRFFNGSAYVGGTTSDYASIQLAIWKIVNPTLSIVANDGFAATALANMPTWLAASQNQSAGYVYYKNMSYKSNGMPASQDLVEAVPEPFTMVLGAASLALAIAKRRRAGASV